MIFRLSNKHFYPVMNKSKIQSIIQATSIINNIDGDMVRKYISFDLGYNIKDRKKQLNRLYGVSKICLKNKYFPIVSSVLMTKHYQKILKKEKILLVKVERESRFQNIKLKKKKNVVGLDIKYEKFHSKYFINNKSLKKNILKLFK